jgi:NADPH:quinone reductase-like Zn-dependent oxidoreductase
MVIEGFGGPECLRSMEMPKPVPGRDEVLIRVVAAGVNPIDCKLRAGYMSGITPGRERAHRFPVILGWDAAGIVDDVGPGVERFAPGDPVYANCLKPIVSRGAYAEYVAVPAQQVAAKPESIDLYHSAVVPVAALTAYQALVVQMAVRQRERVLITAGAGGVGSFAIQIANALGAHVIATASPANHAYLRMLGAADAIDYRDDDVIEAARERSGEQLDAVLHCVTPL